VATPIKYEGSPRFRVATPREFAETP
jgi:hypothetical protein